MVFFFFEKPPTAIEVHPGISDYKKNNYVVFSKAIKMIIGEIQKIYHYKPIILIENRTGQIIQDGHSINKFWNYFKNKNINLIHYVGIILDIQQFFTVTRSNFNNELELIPYDSLYGVHIHTKHRAPSIKDEIPWKKVFTYLKNIRKSRIFFILPEVHHERQLIETIHFIRKYKFI